MRMVVISPCSADHRFGLMDPTGPTESEFENDVARALACVRPDCVCIPFRGTFEFEGHRHQPDLALVARDLSHWFIIEVELVAHSLRLHVLPQVRTFRIGQWHDDCVTSLSRSLDIPYAHARSILAFLPRSVVVVTNQWAASWEDQLRGADVDLVTVSVFKGRDGTVAYDVDGTLEVSRVSLGFGRYAATDRSIRMSVNVDLAAGDIQLDEEAGGVATWTVSRSPEATWITKARGLPALEDGELVQLLRTMDGRISLRTCGTR